MRARACVGWVGVGGSVQGFVHGILHSLWIRFAKATVPTTLATLSLQPIACAQHLITAAHHMRTTLFALRAKQRKHLYYDSKHTGGTIRSHTRTVLILRALKYFVDFVRGCQVRLLGGRHTTLKCAS